MTGSSDPKLVRCPVCPMCGRPPFQEFLASWPGQAWCVNEQCDTICWDASKTLEENLTNARIHRFPGSPEPRA